MNYSAFLTQVDEFHRCFAYRQPTPVAPDLSDSATNALRCSLLREELRELADAVRENDRVGILDALCDIQYVLSGAVLAWGMRSMFENHRHCVTLRKLHDEDAHLARMNGCVDMLEASAELGFEHQAWSHLVQLQSDLTQSVWHWGFSPVFAAAFKNVHESNMSKLWTDEEYKAYDGDYVCDIARCGGERAIIMRRLDGKIMKSPSFTPVSLAQFV